VSVGLDFGRAVDDLTGAHDSRFLLEQLDRDAARCARYGRPLSVVVLDLDRLGAINDEHGHLAGDLTLRQVAQRLRGQMRREEVLARWAGGELVVVLPEAAHDAAVQLAERMLGLISGEPVRVLGRELAVSISAGVATLSGGQTAGQLLEHARAALLEAKQLGKNRVVARAA
jgi:diguanylate cyclase (GGDEF)-like protein